MPRLWVYSVATILLQTGRYMYSYKNLSAHLIIPTIIIEKLIKILKRGMHFRFVFGLLKMNKNAYIIVFFYLDINTINVKAISKQRIKTHIN